MTNKLLYVNIINSDDICVHSLAFSACGHYLAASYANNIAIYDVETNFLLTTLSDVDVDASFRAIIWIPLAYKPARLSEYRLLTLGLHGIISEWDLSLFTHKNSIASYGGAIFAGVAAGPDLVVACDDGSVRAFAVWDEPDSPNRKGELAFKRVLLRHTRSVLSVCALPDGRLFCGTSDSLILAGSQKEGSRVSVMRVAPKKKLKRPHKEAEEAGAPAAEGEDAQVWCLAHIATGNTLASGDSNGNVILWDLETLTMLQMFTQHNNDVIALALLNDATLFSAGLDSKVVLYTNAGESSRAEGADTDNQPGKWSVGGFKYPLKGDIRAMRVDPAHDVVATAGNFGCISVCNVQKFLSYKKTRQKLAFPNIAPFHATIAMNRAKNLALCRHTFHCDLWYIPTANIECGESLGSISSFDNNSRSEDLSSADRNRVPERLDSSVPYKLCTMNMNRAKGRIKSSCLSPSGEVVAIAHEVGLTVLVVDLKDLKVSQVKVEHPRIAVLAMAFLSNVELALCHQADGAFPVSVYNLSEGTLRELDYLRLNKYLLKIEVHATHAPGSDSEPSTQSSGDRAEPKDGDDAHGRRRRWGALYCLDGEVCLVDFDARRFLSLPPFEAGSRICALAFRHGSHEVAVFSTAFRYYLFDVAARATVSYNDRLVHQIPSRVSNPTAAICNAFWVSNVIIVHTTHNIFYVKLLQPPFHELDPKQPKTGAAGQAEGTDGRLSRHALASARPGRVVIGPRRLYSIPSIEHTMYAPPTARQAHAGLANVDEIGEPATVDAQACKYASIAKSKFIVHADIFTRESGVNIVAFRTTLKDEVARKKRYGS